MTRTIYVEIGVLNAVDSISEGWNVSRNEAIQRILSRGVSGIIADDVERNRELASRRPIPPIDQSQGYPKDVSQVKE